MDKQKLKEFFVHHPFFSGFSAQNIDDLIPLVEEIVVNSNGVVSREGEKIDSIFLVADGQAKVTRDIVNKDYIGKTTQTILQKNDLIGLSDEGMFAREGQRTTTVTAITPMVLYRIRLEDFDKFIQHHLALYPNLKKTMELILKINFIKCAAPFAFLDVNDLYWLADQLEEMEVPAGTILFRQGDKGDQAYLIEQGQVAVLKEDEKGEVKEKIMLKAPEIFGEIALISGKPRNATIEAVEDSRLLVIDRTSLEKVMQNNHKVAVLLNKLIRENDKPVAVKNITMQRIPPDENVIILQDAESHYVHLTEQSLLVWQQIDGNNTVGDITNICSQQLGIDARDMVNKTLSDLVYAGLVAVN